ncbi:MAG: DMT family transporter [Proteobacteria bacterium]|nr:DMT family transporter [Desulfobacula sp.]MBU3953625.1 DMT family transporter [Pseudomonadota bacterium]MBU4129269.1 DMT family transporter [Pseudomonadota bacterium]
MDTRTALGCLAVFGSAFFFYLATVIIKWSSMAGFEIDSSLFTFARFSMGFVTVLLVMGIGRYKIKIVKKRLLIGRAIGNCMAVYCFFKGVELTSVSQANILNMTYPLFITLFSWIFFKGRQDPVAVFIVLIAFAGVWLILAPDKLSFDFNSLWGLASGISAAVAIMVLNLSRKVHDTHTTLFFMFGLGTLIVFFLFFDQMRLPSAGEFSYLFWCSAIAIAGQYLFTLGFKYVTAIEGGIISSTRILLAAMLGPFIAMDASLSLSGWTGAFLIFAANVYLTARKAKG